MFNKLKRTVITTGMVLSGMFILEAVFISGNTMGYEEKISQPAPEVIEENSSVAELFSFEIPTIPDDVGTGTFDSPLDGIFTSGYGQRWGRLHGGIDIAAETGTPIAAADNGKVIFTGDCGSYGMLVKIDHQNGYVTYYAHCSKINVSVGDTVKKGDIISLVGSTGNSTGPHCHFEVRYNNERKNPLDYVKI